MTEITESRADWPQSWCISYDLFAFIRRELGDEGTILELGSGWGTNVLSKYYTTYSVESEKEWLDKYDSNYIYAPIVKYDSETPPPDIPGLAKLGKKKQSGWYDANILREKLSGLSYDLILVDGPKARVGRGGFYVWLDLFDTSVPIIFDDIIEDGEFILMEKVAAKLGKSYQLLPDGIRDDDSFGVVDG